MGRLDDKVALITGAGRGQGRSHALTLAREGADIIAVDICRQIESHPFPMGTEEDLAATKRLVQALGRRIMTAKVDVRDEAELRAAVDQGVAELGRLDIILCNAGIGPLGPSLEMSEQDWDECVDVILKGSWQTAKVGIPHILAGGRGGSIVLTGSTAGIQGRPGLVPYVAAKHGLLGLMRSLAIEWGPHGIRANLVHPTQTNTPMCMNDLVYSLFCPDIENPTQEDFAPRSQAMHVLPTPWVEPEDISNAILFLVSDDARFITGVSLPVDAGADLIG